MHPSKQHTHPRTRLVCRPFSPTLCRDARGNGKVPASDSLQLPDVDAVLPLQKALQGLPSQPPTAVTALYQHWCQKRHFSERPLLQRLWYEPPWHRLTVAGWSAFSA